jgi:hypothetical protein
MRHCALTCGIHMFYMPVTVDSFPPDLREPLSVRLSMFIIIICQELLPSACFSALRCSHFRVLNEMNVVTDT